jgi:hypothetical protein
MSKMTPSQALAAAVRALLDAIEIDEHRSGGLLSHETYHKAALVRVALARARVPDRAEARAR